MHLSTGHSPNTFRISLAIVMAVSGLASGCGDVNAALRRESEARRLSADLLLEFTRAADASNRAVMTEADPVALKYAHEANEAKEAVQKDVDTIGPLLQGLGYTDESRLLQEFVTRFAEYKTLDRQILDLAVENTNRKAQRLSFGPAQTTADAFREALDAVVPSNAAKDAWRVKALVATAVGAVREIQALQAPHIAEPEDASMTTLEKRMTTAEQTARNALQTLQTVIAPASRPHVAAATDALNQFMGLNAQIIGLSRRNTNVRSLALSLDQKRNLIAPCEQGLRALRDAMAKHGYPVGR